MCGFGGKTLQKLHTFVGISFFVEPGTPNSNAILLRMQGNDSPSDTAFTGQTYIKGKIPGFVVKSAGLHNSVDPFRLAQSDDLFVRLRMAAVVHQIPECLG